MFVFVPHFLLKFALVSTKCKALRAETPLQGCEAIKFIKTPWKREVKAFNDFECLRDVTKISSSCAVENPR